MAWCAFYKFHFLFFSISTIIIIHIHNTFLVMFDYNDIKNSTIACSHKCHCSDVTLIRTTKGRGTSFWRSKFTLMITYTETSSVSKDNHEILLCAMIAKKLVTCPGAFSVEKIIMDRYALYYSTIKHSPVLKSTCLHLRGSHLKKK